MANGKRQLDFKFKCMSCGLFVRTWNKQWMIRHMPECNGGYEIDN